VRDHRFHWEETPQKIQDEQKQKMIEPAADVAGARGNHRTKPGRCRRPGAGRDGERALVLAGLEQDGRGRQARPDEPQEAAMLRVDLEEQPVVDVQRRAPPRAREGQRQPRVRAVRLGLHQQLVDPVEDRARTGPDVGRLGVRRQRLEPAVGHLDVDRGGAEVHRREPQPRVDLEQGGRAPAA